MGGRTVGVPRARRETLRQTTRVCGPSLLKQRRVVQLLRADVPPSVSELPLSCTGARRAGARRNGRARLGARSMRQALTGSLAEQEALGAWRAGAISMGYARRALGLGAAEALGEAKDFRVALPERLTHLASLTLLDVFIG